MIRFSFFLITLFFSFFLNAHASWLQNATEQSTRVADVVNNAIAPLEIQAAATMTANGLNTAYSFLPANYTPNAQIITVIQQVSSTNGGVTTYSDAFKVTLADTASVSTILQGKVLTFTAISGQNLQSPGDIQWSCTGNINDGVLQLNPTNVALSFLLKNPNLTENVNFLSSTPLAACQFS